ncbi:hypothetical protein Taro_035326 [Colocasia esculenta]|uniref:Uncharacterized protein n=1 Tax=Colocasia esculenta TaxID=4460 RepID=A0A843W6C0_COLES|nr:hypothetical protein [Colocasia esculenta]
MEIVVALRELKSILDRTSSTSLSSEPAFFELEEEEETVSHLVVFEVCKHRRKCLDKRVFLSKRLTPLCVLLSPRSGR